MLPAPCSHSESQAAAGQLSRGLLARGRCHPAQISPVLSSESHLQLRPSLGDRSMCRGVFSPLCELGGGAQCLVGEGAEVLPHNSCWEPGTWEGVPEKESFAPLS